MPPLYLLSSACLYFSSLRQSFRLARDTGFDGMELSLTPASALSSAGHIRSLAQEIGLSLASVHPPTIPLPGWGRSPATFKRLAHLARMLPDCQIVVLHVPDAQGENDPRMSRFYRILETLQEALADSSIAVALETRNCQPGKPLGPLDRPEALLAFSRQQDCRIVLDTAHVSTLPVPLLETYRILRERLANVHLSDVGPQRWWSRFSYPRSIFTHHRVPGQGVLPLRALMEELARDRYDGLITLELSPVALRFWSRPATRRIVRQALQTSRLWLSTQ